MSEDWPSLAAEFWRSVEENAEAPAQTWFDGKNWNTRSYEDYGHAVKVMAASLLARGLKRGQRVALWSKNHIRWGEVDFANQTVGSSTVPVYDTLTGDQAAYILEDSDAKFLFVQDEKLLNHAQLDWKRVSGLQQVVLLDGEPSESAHKLVMGYDEFTAKGLALLEKDASVVDEARWKVSSSDLASLVYTSGTTGDPKGVMLTQANFCSNALAAAEVVKFGKGDVFLSFLPLSHVFERTGGHFAPYLQGAHVCFARSIDTLTEDMAMHRPTFMMSVPRLYEKIYARITKAIGEGSPVKRFLFKHAVATGRAANVYRTTGRPLPPGLARRVKFYDKLVYSKLRARVGGRLRYFVSGGAALNKEIEEFFWAVGINILQGYGLTETSPVTNVNAPNKTRFGSVGVPVPHAEVKIDPTGWTSTRKDYVEGEILLKGPMVMQGYYNKPEATKEVFTADGFFRSGDIGYIDSDNYLFITDRKKEILVLANGKNVAPQPIEGLLKLQPHIEQACIIGDDKNFISALIVPDFEALEEFAAREGIVAGPGDDLVKQAQVRSLFEREVEAVNAQLARFEQIKRFQVLGAEWSVEGGELTPSLKLKRRVILSKFEPFVQKLYEGVERFKSNSR